MPLELEKKTAGRVPVYSIMVECQACGETFKPETHLLRLPEFWLKPNGVLWTNCPCIKCGKEFAKIVNGITWVGTIPREYGL